VQVSSNGLVTNFSGVAIGGDSTANSNNSFNQLIVTNGGVAINNTGNTITIGRSDQQQQQRAHRHGPRVALQRRQRFDHRWCGRLRRVSYGNSLQANAGGVLSNAGTITVDSSNSQVSAPLELSMRTPSC